MCVCFFAFAIHFEAAKVLQFSKSKKLYYREKQKLRKTGNLEIFENVMLGKFFISELKIIESLVTIFYQSLKL